MKRLHIFIIKSFLGPLIATFFISLFVLLMQFMFRYIEDMVGKGLEASIVLEFTMYAAATLIPMALPLSVLLASIMTMGNLGENYELTALKASGISLQRIMSPLIVFIVAMSIGAFFYSNIVIPEANTQLLALYKDIEKSRPELQIKEGVFNDAIENFSVRIARKDPKTNTLYGLKIYNHRDKPDNVEVTIADSGRLVFKALQNKILVELFDGYTYQEVLKKKNYQKNRPFRKDKFKSKKFYIKLKEKEDRTDASMFKNRYKMLNIRRLNRSIDSISNLYNKQLKQQQTKLFNQDVFKKERAIRVYAREVSIPPKDVPTRQIQKELKNGEVPDKKEKKIEKAEIKEVKKNKLPEIVVATFKRDSLVDSVFNSYKEKGMSDVYALFNDLPADSKIGVLSKAINEAKTTAAGIENQDRNISYKRESIIRREIEWHRKFILSFACFVFFFIGAPLGAIIRKGGLGLPVVISIIFFIIYYIITNMGEKLAREGVISPFEGMWISSVILLPVGAFLTYKSTTDSSMLNMDAYRYFFIRFGKAVKAIFSKQKNK